MPVRAQVIISEIMYDLSEGSDTDREWIEVYNEGEAVDFTEWKLVEGTTNHSLTALGASELQSGAYAVIVDNVDKFKADWPSYSGLLFDSSFSLSNSGEKLGLRCCKKELSDKDSITFSSEMGAAGDGASLSRSGSTFVPTDPTPGAAPGAARAVEAAPKKETAKLPEPKLPEPKPVAKVAAAEPEPVPEPKPLPPPEPAVERVPEPEPVKAKAQTASAKNVEEKTVAVRAESEIQPEPAAPEIVPETQVAAVGTVAPGGTGSWAWMLGALVIALAGGAATYLVRRSQKKTWKVEESA